MGDYISRDDAVKRIDEALSRVFVEPVGESILSKLPAADVIPLGVELWSDRFEIKRRGWRSEDGEHMAESFMIVRKEDSNGD